MKTNLLKMLSLAILSLPLGACGGAPDSEEQVGTGQTENAFTGNWNYSWRDSKANSTEIGTATNRTCFMTGLAGDFEPFYSPYSAFPSVASSAGVRVNAAGNWEIYVAPQRGAIEVWARCVNVASVEHSGWVTNGAYGATDVDLGPATSSRRCFLSQLVNDVYRDSTGVGWWGFTQKGTWVSNANPYSGDHVRITTKVAPDFTAHWYITADQPSMKSQVHASARCFTVGQDDGSWEWIAPNPGAGQNDLTATAGATCGLTGIGGAFTVSDYSDGAFITTSGNQFLMNTKNEKVGFATCMK